MSPTRSAPILGSICRRTPLPPFPPSRDASAEASVPLRWPVHDGLDLGAVLPAASGLTEWLYAVGLREGWCAVTHPSRSVGLALQFDPHLFRTTWLWGVYGGWRGHYVLLTEPSTSPPGGLARQRRRRHRCLARRRFGDRDRRHGRRDRRDRGNRRSRLARPAGLTVATRYRCVVLGVGNGVAGEGPAGTVQRRVVDMRDRALRVRS